MPTLGRSASCVDIRSAPVHCGCYPLSTAHLARPGQVGSEQPCSNNSEQVTDRDAMFRLAPVHRGGLAEVPCSPTEGAIVRIADTGPVAFPASA